MKVHNGIKGNQNVLEMNQLIILEYKKKKHTLRKVKQTLQVLCILPPLPTHLHSIVSIKHWSIKTRLDRHTEVTM